MEQWREDLYLSHHGILGMRWGHQNGPPYPLDASDHSASEKKAGWRKSLDKKVKKREKPAGKIGYKQVKEEYDNIENKVEKIKNLNKSSDNIQNLADELYKDYEKAFNSVELSSKQKEKIWSNLHDIFGDGPYNSELFDDEVKWHVDDEIMNNVHKAIGVKREKFDEAQNKYWKDCEELVDSVVSKYKDTSVADANRYGQNVSVKSAVYSMLSNEADTSFMSYMSRHFDDYWVNDTDAHYNSIERLSKDFSMKEYNKKYRS